MTFLFNADLVWIKQRKRCLFKCNQLILDAVWDWMWLWLRGQSNSSVLLLLFPEEPYYRFKSWRSSRNERVCSHAYTVIYPWHLLMFLTYFFSLQMNALTHKHTARDSSPSLPAITLNIRDAPTETDKHHCAGSVRTAGALTTATQHWRIVEKDVGRPHSLHCYSLSWIQALCAADRREGHTHNHTNTHIYMLKQIFHTCWLQPARPFNFLLWLRHTQAHIYTKKLIDYLTKNQLGAGYVRAPRAKEGGTAANSKRGVNGGAEGGTGKEWEERRDRFTAYEDKMWRMQQRQRARGRSFWHCSIFLICWYTYSIWAITMIELFSIYIF